MSQAIQKRFLILLAILLCAGACAYWARARGVADPSTTPEIVRLLPADANGIAYMDLSALRNIPDSPLSALINSKDFQPRGTDHDYQDFVRDTGFDFRHDLDRAAIAFWPAPGAKAAAGGKPNPGPGFSGRMLLIADGRFDQKKIESYALRTGKIVGSGAHASYQIPGNPPTAFKFISADRIEFASGDNSLQLLSSPAPSSFDDMTTAGLSRVSAAPLFSVFRNRDLPLNIPGAQQQSQQIAQLLRSLQTISIAGVPDRRNVDIVIDGQCDSMSSALQIATLLEFSRSGAAMFLSNSKQRQSSPASHQQIEFLNGLLQQVKITHDDRWVRLSLALTPEMMAQAQSLPGKTNPSRPQ